MFVSIYFWERIHRLKLVTNQNEIELKILEIKCYVTY